MNCTFAPIADGYQCGACGFILRTRLPLPIIRWCGTSAEPLPKPKPPSGPGTELTAILHSCGLRDESQCQCRERAYQMNLWGVAGCREHFEEIVSWLRESYDRLGWAEKLKAAMAAVGSGLALQIDPRDPPRSLVELAIQRAEQKQQSTPRN